MKILFLAFAIISISSTAFAADASLATKRERDFIQKHQDWERELTNYEDALFSELWTLRSGHFVFGMPQLTDDRHVYTPEGFNLQQPGVSIVVREGFVVAHFDRMKSPLWVAQRWTKYDYERMGTVEAQDRPWREDLDLPEYTRGGVSYDGNDTDLDRGHMARHAPNRAWGIDVSNWGVKMSNSTPQHKSINRGQGWRSLEDEVRDIVNREGSGIEAIWIYTGAIFRDKENPDNETPEDDFDKVVRLTDGDFSVPDATFKVIGWFDKNQEFQARAYAFEQPHESRFVSGEQRPRFDLPSQNLDLEEYIISIDELEDRVGVDFFPLLRDDVENLIEGHEYDNIWGEE